MPGSFFGGLTGAQQEAETSSLENRNLLNFAPFQRPAIDSLFGALTPDLLGLSPAATGLAGQGIGGFSNLLSGFAQRPGEQDLRGLFDVARNVSDLAGQFNPAIDRFEEVFDEADVFGGVAGRARELGGRFRGLTDAELARDPTARAFGFLSPFARGDFVDPRGQDNPFLNRIVQAALDDATARTTATFSGAGRLQSGIAPRAVARETGRISGDIRGRAFEAAENRRLQQRQQQLGAGGTIGGLDLNNAIRRLNAISQGSSAELGALGAETSALGTGANIRLNAAGGVLGGISAEQGERARRLGLAGNIGGNLANLQQFGLQQAIPQAAGFSELPFVPLTNFSNIAFSPLGQSGTIARSGTATGTSGTSPLSTALGLGLTGASFFGGKPGSGGIGSQAPGVVLSRPGLG